MSKPQYFIEVDTYWQNSASYFVGPFESKAEADAWFNTDEWTARDNTWLSTSLCGGDIRSAWRIYPAPLSKTEARKHGLRTFGAGDSYSNEIPARVKPQARALSNEVAVMQEDYAY